jgi:hypothetical protein
MLKLAAIRAAGSCAAYPLHHTIGHIRLCSRTALAAENLFLRKQLALFQEREKKKPRKARIRIKAGMFIRDSFVL